MQAMSLRSCCLIGGVGLLCLMEVEGGAPPAAPPERHWSIEPPPTVLWQIGYGDDSEAEFDTDPHDDPVTVNYNFGDPFSTFPSQSGTDIGPQRSVINIIFALPAAERARLALRWSAGGSAATERFQVLLDDALVGLSRIRAGSVPTVWDTESFDLSTLAPGQHVITLVHLQGDGLWWDCLALQRCQVIITGMDLFKGQDGRTRVVLCWPSLGGEFYTVEGTGDLALGFHDVLKSNFVGLAPVTSFTNTPPADAARYYYRISLPQ